MKTGTDQAECHPPPSEAGAPTRRGGYVPPTGPGSFSGGSGPSNYSMPNIKRAFPPKKESVPLLAAPDVPVVSEGLERRNPSPVASSAWFWSSGEGDICSRDVPETFPSCDQCLRGRRSP